MSWTVRRQSDGWTSLIRLKSRDIIVAGQFVHIRDGCVFGGADGGAGGGAGFAVSDVIPGDWIFVRVSPSHAEALNLVSLVEEC